MYMKGRKRLLNYKLNTEVTMKKTLNRISYFFLGLTLVSILSIGIAILADTKEKEDTKPTVYGAINADSDSNLTMSSILSALGGFSGGGLLLIFLIRRLVSSYDKNFSDWAIRCSQCNKTHDEKNDKLITMVEDVRKMTQEMNVEVIKLQANTADKSTVTKAITKIAVLETDLSQVRTEVKSIMAHLLK